MAKQTFTTGQVLSAAQMTSLQQTAMGGGSATPKTASYVLTAADAGCTVIMNAAGATTITVNTGLFASGDTVFIQNIGAGVCTITAGTATVNTAGSLALAQYEGASLYFTATGAAILNDYTQGSGGPTFSGCSVSKSSAQTLASNTATVITFDTELFDVDGYHSNTTNNSRMTIPSGKAGYFFLYAKFRLDAGGSTGGFELRILKNGTAVSSLFSASPASIAVTGGQISQIVNGAVGDYFEIDVRQLTTGNQDMPGGATNAQFMISYIGA